MASCPPQPLLGRKKEINTVHGQMSLRISPLRSDGTHAWCVYSQSDQHEIFVRDGSLKDFKLTSLHLSPQVLIKSFHTSLGCTHVLNIIPTTVQGRFFRPL